MERVNLLVKSAPLKSTIPLSPQMKAQEMRGKAPRTPEF